MFKALGGFFAQRGAPAPKGSEIDVRHYIQNYLRAQIKSEAVYCESVSSGVVVVAVSSPTAQQEAYLLRAEVARDVLALFGYGVRRYLVTRRS